MCPGSQAAGRAGKGGTQGPPASPSPRAVSPVRCPLARTPCRGSAACPPMQLHAAPFSLQPRSPGAAAAPARGSADRPPLHGAQQQGPSPPPAAPAVTRSLLRAGRAAMGPAETGVHLSMCPSIPASTRPCPSPSQPPSVHAHIHPSIHSFMPPSCPDTPGMGITKGTPAPAAGGAGGQWRT